VTVRRKTPARYGNTCLNQGITSIKHGNTDVELVTDESQVFLETIKSGIGDSVLIELVHEVHGKHNRHDVPIEFSNELGLFRGVECIGAKVIGLGDRILGLEITLDIIIVFVLGLGDGVVVACRLFELNSPRRGINDVGRSRGHVWVVESRHI